MNRFDFWTDEELEEIQNDNMYFDEVIKQKAPCYEQEGEPQTQKRNVV